MSHSATSAPSSVTPRERTVRTAFGLLAMTNAVLGAWMVIDPGSFFDTIGPFGAVNDHYVRDVASWTLAYAGVLAIAVGSPAWRVPVLALGILQSALHVLNHVVDVNDADPGWIGWFDVISLTLLMAVMAWLLSASRVGESGAWRDSTRRDEAAR